MSHSHYGFRGPKVHVHDETEDKVLRKLNMAERALRNEFSRDQEDSKVLLMKQETLTKQIERNLELAIIAGTSITVIATLVAIGLCTSVYLARKSINYYHNE